MHELSIACSLIELATDAARRHGADGISAVHVRIGAMAGVVTEALEFAFEAAREGTPCATARLVIEQVPITVRCPTCATPKTLVDPACFRCPDCGSPTPELLTGRELDLISLEVDTHEAAYS